MMSGMYAAISGLDAHQTMLDVTANNLANVDTVGYKSQSTVFSDELTQLMQAGTGPNGFNAGTNPLQVGLGVHVNSIDNHMAAGGVESTGISWHGRPDSIEVVLPPLAAVFFTPES